MAAENEKAILEAIDFEGKEVSLDELEQSLEAELEEKFEDLEFLHKEREHINNPDHLGETVMNVVWEQFMNQVAATAGEDFIKENRGMTLDLRSEAHIQTADNFERQNYATHNTFVDYESRGEEYRSNFYTDPNNKPQSKQKQPQRYNEDTKTWEHYDPVDGAWKKTLQKEYRKPYEEDRRKDVKNKFGSKNLNKDHQVSDADIARDARAGAYMTTEEKVQMANSEDNLYDLDSAANQSKSDHDGEKWVKHKRTGGKGEGQTNGEYFGIDEEKYIEQDKKAKQAKEEKVAEKEAENIALGKKSQKDEAFRIGGKALRAALMSLLAALVKEVIGKLVLWLKSAEKSLNTLLEYVKMAIRSFVGKLKGLLVNAADSVITTILTSIFDKVIGTIKKVFTLLKQGWKSLQEAVQYLKKTENKGKPLSQLLPQVGIIVVTGLSGISAILLGELIEDGLIALLPALGVDIPVLGKPANLIGMLMGAIVCGVIGAIAINLINKYVAKQQKTDNLNAQIDKKNEILNIQDKLTDAKIEKMANTKEQAARSMMERREQAKNIISDAMTTIFHEEDGEEDNSGCLSGTASDLAKLLD